MLSLPLHHTNFLQLEWSNRTELSNEKIITVMVELNRKVLMASVTTEPCENQSIDASNSCLLIICEGKID